MPRCTGGDPLTGATVSTCAMERLEAVTRFRQLLAGWRPPADRDERRLTLRELSSNDSATAVVRSTVDRST